MANLNVTVPEAKKDYDLKIEKGLLKDLANQVKAIYSNNKIALVTDENVDHYYGQLVVDQLEEAGFELKKIVLEPGEQTKSIDHLLSLYESFIDFDLTRSDLIIALGGGVIGDLAGYAAASYLRGISYIHVPTTLLAQVDSSVGGKVAIDLPQGKNLVGDFYHPQLVIIDPNVLDTLEDSTFADGMAEVIKYGCIKDKSFFNQLSHYDSRQDIMEDIEEVIYICCKIKAQLVEEDEKDLSQRMLLNFGHTLGHAIEAYYHYDDYTHGKAISIGMVAMAHLCEQAKISPSGLTEDIKKLLELYQLPTYLDRPEDYTQIIPLIKNDKKNIHGSLNVVVLDQLGQAQTMKADHQFFDPLLKGDSSND